MPLFDYTGQLASGSSFQGTLEAENRSGAEATLAGLGVRVLALRETRRAAFVAPLSVDEVTLLNEQLAATARAGLPLQEGLRQLAADVGSRRLKRVLLDLAADVEQGVPLTEAIERQRRRFPAQYPDVIRAGLATGDLGGTLYAVTAHYRLRGIARRAVLEIVTYPILVLLLAFWVASFVMRYVVPMLQSTMQDIATPLTASALSGQMLFWLADVWPVVEFCVVGVVLAAILYYLVTLLPDARPAREALVRRLPLAGRVYGASVLARFCHTTALGALAGRPLPELITAGGGAAGDSSLAATTRRVAEKLERGQSLDQAAAGESPLPALWTCAVNVAGPRGDLPAVLAELARMYEQRAEEALSTLRALLGPLLLLIVALILGGLVVAVISVIQTLVIWLESTAF